MKPDTNTPELPGIESLVQPFKFPGISLPGRECGPVHWVSSSGTTGLGMRFPETIECFQREYAYRFENYSQAGVQLGNRWVICAGHPVAAPERMRPPFWVHDWVNRWCLMSSNHLSEANLPAYVAELARFDPVLVGGYPSSVYLLALANQKAGCPLRPKAVFTSSETLMDFQRVAIEASFGCRPRSYYGNAERCAFIAECEHGLFHVREEHSFVELLDDDGRDALPGQSGRLVCTGFGNWATPLIRYEVGDIGIRSLRSHCPCGRSGLLLDAVLGRMDDYVVTPDGRYVGRLDHLFKDATRVKMAQLFQDSPQRLVIRVVREPGYEASDEAGILREARLRLGDRIEICFEYVSEIERTKAGKFRFIVSRLSNREMFGRRLPSVDGSVAGEPVHHLPISADRRE